MSVGAERLQHSAEVLWERAENTTSPGNHFWYDDAESFAAMLATEFKFDDRTQAAAAFIVMMSPTLALLLGDWLSAAASRYKFGWSLGETPDVDPYALKIADLILGDE